MFKFTIACHAIRDALRLHARIYELCVAGAHASDDSDVLIVSSVIPSACRPCAVASFYVACTELGQQLDMSQRTAGAAQLEAALWHASLQAAARVRRGTICITVTHAVAGIANLLYRPDTGIDTGVLPESWPECVMALLKSFKLHD